LSGSADGLPPERRDSPDGGWPGGWGHQWNLHYQHPCGSRLPFAVRHLRSWLRQLRQKWSRITGFNTAKSG